MAYQETDTEIPRRARGRTMFGEHFPDYMSWLDGRVWVLDIETEILPKMTIARFRAALYYQATLWEQKLATRTEQREVGGDKRQVLLVQAYTDPETDS